MLTSSSLDAYTPAGPGVPLKELAYIILFSLTEIKPNVVLPLLRPTSFSGGTPSPHTNLHFASNYLVSGLGGIGGFL